MVWRLRCGFLLGNLGFDEFSQKNERLLPAKIASLGGYDSGHALLHDAQLSPTRNLLQVDSHLQQARQVRVVKPVRVADGRSFGTNSRYSPPKEWLLPVVKLQKDILKLPPTFGSMW